MYLGAGSKETLTSQSEYLYKDQEPCIPHKENCGQGKAWGKEGSNEDYDNVYQLLW